MSLSTDLGLRNKAATLNQVADAFDYAVGNQKSNTVVSASGTESVLADGIIFVANTTDITRTMPAPSTCQGKIFTFVKVTDNLNTCLINTASGLILGGDNNLLRRIGDQRSYISNGTAYFMLSNSPYRGAFTYTPSYSASGSMTFSVSALTYARYWLTDDLMDIQIRLEATVGGTVSTDLNISSPFAANGSEQVIPLQWRQSLSGTPILGIATINGSTISCRKSDASNWSLNTVSLILNGRVRIVN